MKIGFDISQTGKLKAGCGFFADNLIRSLSAIDSCNLYTLYQTFGDQFWDPTKSTLQISQKNFKYGFCHTDLSEAKDFWSTLPDNLEQQLGSVDILHANNFFCPPRQLKKHKNHLHPL